MISNRLSSSLMPILLVCGVFAGILGSPCQERPRQSEADLNRGPGAGAERLPGWNLSVQTYSFRTHTLVESMDLAIAAGLDALEIYADQPIGGDVEEVFNHHLSDTARQLIRELLHQKGVRFVAYGVVNARDAADWEKLYAFVKEMGGTYLIVEPDPHLLPEVGRLATAYEIRTAIHNHPGPSQYWSPEVVLESIVAANSPYVGACADIGHWLRSGLDPLKSLEQLDGHVLSLHFKDLNEASARARDVVWGEGVIDIEGIIGELIRQSFDGNITAEYEDDPQGNLGNIRQSIINFRSMLAAAMTGT